MEIKNDSSFKNQNSYFPYLFIKSLITICIIICLKIPYTVKLIRRKLYEKKLKKYELIDTGDFQWLIILALCN